MKFSNKLILIISNISKYLKFSYIKLQKYFNTFINKQKSIKGIYSPFLEQKIKTKTSLIKDTLSLENHIKILSTKIKKAKKQNIEIQNSINELQNLLINGNKRV